MEAIIQNIPAVISIILPVVLALVIVTNIIVDVLKGLTWKKLPTNVHLYPRHGVKRPSTALCEHIITIEKSCLLNHLGTIVNTDAECQLDDALRVSIGLKA